MPIYEFECPACSERFDRLQRLNDPDPDSCPNCGATGIRRRLTAPSFRLAGSGWYETDFKKDADKKRNLAEKPEAAKTEGSPDAKPKADAAGEKKPKEKGAEGNAKPPADGKSKPRTDAVPTPKPAAKPDA